MSKARDLADFSSVAPDIGRRNLIINGAMQVAQRGTSKSFAHDGTNSGYLIDRFDLELQAVNDQLDGTYAQVTDAPDGFSSSLKWTTGTAETTIDADENMRLEYHIEAQDLQHLKYGTASAQSLTLSFWVKSSVTGTYAVSLYQADGVRMIGSTYAISTADTWQYVTLTFAGDASGTINNDTGEGLRVIWTLASGSNFNATDNTSWGAFNLGMFSYGHAQNGVMTTSGATWQITGVQLEVGTVATPFEHRSYVEELALCQRYYTEFGNHTVFAGRAYGSADLLISAVCPVPLRASPTVGGSGDMKVFGATVSDAVTMSAVGAFQFTANTNTVVLDINTYSGLSDNRVANTGITNSGTLTLDAEL